ncbi:hypothetical protein [Pseudomonas farris]
MSDPLIDLGDIPAWIALAVSIFTFTQQSKQNNKTTLEREELQKSSTEKLRDFQRKLRLEQMIKDLDDLLMLTVDYWTQPGNTGSTSALMIKSKSQDLAYRCNDYNRFLWDSAASEFSGIRRAITGGAFEVKSRVAISTNDPFIREASNMISNFKTKLRQTCDSLDRFL